MILIVNGKLLRAACSASVANVDLGIYPPPFELLLTELSGDAVTGSYEGPGFDNGDHVLLGRADACRFTEYRIAAEPTKESKERRDGFFARLDTLRAVRPRHASVAYIEGWCEADTALRASPTTDKIRKEALRLAKKLG